MSNALAIAAVTRVLQDLLNNGLIDADVSDRVGNVPVTALPPDRLVNGGTERNRLNLFLYNVSHNPGWRNVDLPSRDAAGLRSTNPPLALDLHYLVTAYGEQELNAEILLGYAMQLLHETSVLSRAAIRRALRTTADGEAVETTILPSALRALVASDLAEQVELIKITPAPMTSEDMSKLWTALQTHYRPSAAYHLSVVLIQSEKPTRVPFPVLSRGPVIGDRDQGPVVQANLVPPSPTLFEFRLPAQRSRALPGNAVTIEGVNLSGAATVRLIHARLSDPVTVRLDGDRVSATTIAFALPEDLAAGIYTVLAEIEPRDGGELRRTNALPLMVAPTITSIAGSEITSSPTAIALPADTTELNVEFRPRVRPEQAVSLFIGGREVAAPAFSEPTESLIFRLPSDLTSGEYLARLRIDGAEPDLIDRAHGQLRYRDDVPRVIIR